MQLTDEERTAIIQAMKALEPLAALIPPPGSTLVLAAIHVAENMLDEDIDHNDLEAMRAAVYDRLQNAINAKFGK